MCSLRDRSWGLASLAQASRTWNGPERLRASWPGPPQIGPSLPQASTPDSSTTRCVSYILLFSWRSPPDHQHRKALSDGTGRIDEQNPALLEQDLALFQETHV